MSFIPAAVIIILVQIAGDALTPNNVMCHESFSLNIKS